MNFFEAQDRARRATTRLVILFLLAVATLIGLTELLVLAVIYTQEDVARDGLWAFAAGLGAEFHLGLIAIVALVVALGTLYKFHQLRAGGFVVAELMGGRPVPAETQDAGQRRLLNIVEEMAIASGVPVPPVYLLPHEHGINAFAAGLTTSDAIICVTQGCLEALDRDALQGVIAHEFSHILNGDMRLNINITSVLHGILLLGLIGARMVRHLSGTRRGPTRGRGGAPIALLGAGLMAIGFGGTFFGSIIKASVNRQREYLADAAAVQFTRHPQGIASALKAIAAYAYGSRLLQPNAPEISHFFFAAATRSWFAGLFATHPPLDDRIRRIEPRWDGTLPAVRSPYTEKVMTEEMTDGARAAPPRPGGPLAGLAVTAAAATLGAGTGPTPARIGVAQQILATLPAALVSAARNPFYARALIFALLLSQDAGVRARQLALIRAQAEPGVDAKLASIHKIVQAVGRPHYLTLVEMAIPTLRSCSRAQIDGFRRVLHRLIRSDNHVSLFEWCVMTLVNAGLAAAMGEPVRGRLRPRRLAQVVIQVRVLLSLLAQAEGGGEAARGRYAQAMARLGLASGEMFARQTLHFPTVDNALRQLDNLLPLEKQRLMDACVMTVEEDNVVAGPEVEVLRAVAAALHVATPPTAVGEG